MEILLSGSGRTGKSHLGKVIYKSILKTSLYHCKDPKKQDLFYLGIQEYQSAVNIGGITIHSGLGTKPGTKLLSLDEESKATYRNRLSEVKFSIKHELSMVSSDL